MSEYQYYEWQALDRPLTVEEQAKVSGLSSHIDVTPSRAVVTYNWGDFKHRPLEVLARYFDAFMYFANWGNPWLAFRFPKSLLQEAQVEPYLWEEEVTLEPDGAYLVLSIVRQDEGGYEEVDYEASLSTLARLRDDILQGDYRSLYLAWLLAAGQWNIEEEVEPPVPAGLGQLTSPLVAFARFFDLDTYLIEAAAEGSPARKAQPGVAPEEALARLTPAERDDFLLRLARGEPQLSLVLNRRLQEVAGRLEAEVSTAPLRTLGQIRAAADHLRAETERRERDAAEARRREEHRVAEARRAQMLEALAQRQPAAWRDVDALIQQKTGAAYDQAAELLALLRDLAVREGSLPAFHAHLAEMQTQYARRPALLERLRRLA